MGGNSTRYDYKRVRCEKTISKLLLSCAWGSRLEPVWIRNSSRLNGMCSVGIHDNRREHVRHCVEGPKSLMHRHFENRARRIKRAIYRTNVGAVPAASVPIRTLAAIPRPREFYLV